MWLTSYIAKNKEAVPSVGQVAENSQESLSFNGSSLYKNVQMVAPFGISYCPDNNTEGFLLPVENENVMLGVKAKIDSSLEPGELLLYSSGGARILLKNNGKVYINGKAVG
jgi:hypothetical protein